MWDTQLGYWKIIFFQLYSILGIKNRSSRRSNTIWELLFVNVWRSTWNFVKLQNIFFSPVFSAFQIVLMDLSFPFFAICSSHFLRFVLRPHSLRTDDKVFFLLGHRYHCKIYIVSILRRSNMSNQNLKLKLAMWLVCLY